MSTIQEAVSLLNKLPNELSSIFNYRISIDTEVYAEVQNNSLTMFFVSGTKVEAEQNDRSDLNLPGQQLQLLKDVVEKMQGKSSK